MESHQTNSNSVLEQLVTAFQADKAAEVRRLLQEKRLLQENLAPDLNPGLAPTLESGALMQWNDTTAIGASEIDLFTIFKDDHDAEQHFAHCLPQPQHIRSKPFPFRPGVFPSKAVAAVVA